MLSDIEKNVVSQWFVVRTKSSQEHVAQLHYERQGFTVYYPVVRKTIRHARQKKSVLRPLFPNYIFLKLQESQQDWTAIASTRGSIGAVAFSGQYVPVPDALIEQIKAREEDGALPQKNLDAKVLKPGTPVVVDLFSQDGVQGVVSCLSGQDNVVVLLDFLSRQVKMVVSRELVSVA